MKILDISYFTFRFKYYFVKNIKFIYYKNTILDLKFTIPVQTISVQYIELLEIIKLLLNKYFKLNIAVMKIKFLKQNILLENFK